LEIEGGNVMTTGMILIAAILVYVGADIEIEHIVSHR